MEQQVQNEAKRKLTAEKYALDYVQMHCDLSNMSVVDFANETAKAAKKLEEAFLEKKGGE